MNTGNVAAGNGRGQASRGSHSALSLALMLALPAAWLLRWLAFQVPGLVEHWYAQGLYPRVARALGAINGAVPLSLSEIGIAIGALLAVAWLARTWRRRESLLQWAGRVLVGAWSVAGIAALVFLLLWGLNSAREPLAHRLQLNTEAVSLDEIETLAMQASMSAAASRELAGERSDFRQLDVAIDAGYAQLALPGDAITFNTSPAKRPILALAMSRLGISGIFVPFTGEPTVNGDIPEASLPLAAAHEKAHQRGITDEGEANLAATLVCLRAGDPWLRYSAQLDLAARAINALGEERPEAASRAWRALGEGAHADLEAQREFWERHRGWATEAATRVNDAYLHAQRVPGGVRSYGRVLTLAVAAQRGGLLALAAPPSPVSSPAAQGLIQADREFARDTALRGVEGWVRWFAPDGEMAGPEGPPTRGHDAIRDAMAPAFEIEGFRLEWDPERAEIGAAGDLGVTYGSFRESRLVDGAPQVVRRGRYMTVWKRQPDGAWRALMALAANTPAP